MVHYSPKIYSGEEWVPLFDERYNWQPPTPASDSKLWRYRNLEKYLQILDSESLWFARTDQFDDSFEGYLPSNSYKKWNEEFVDRGLVTRDVFKALRKMTHLNCWHQNDSESVAMWKLYLEDSDGVAISTTPSRLKKALQIDEDQYVTGRVEYIDHSQEGINRQSTISSFFYK